MNQKEWKALIKQPRDKRPRNLFYYRNLAEKLLGYKRGCGFAIHHLRDTLEARAFNDAYYERWGIDFNGELRYTILITVEEHRKLHKLSEETKNKISEAVKIAKTTLTEEEIKQHKYEADKNSRNKKPEYYKKQQKIYYKKNKNKICANVKKYRDAHKKYIAQKKKEWRIKNRDYVNQKKREYYHKNKKI